MELQKSRTWLANKIKRTENMVYQLERGERQPSEETLFRMARALGVPAGELIKDDKEGTSAA
jgi:transcriptional regulator with XRE-family HTH domain